MPSFTAHDLLRQLSTRLLYDRAAIHFALALVFLLASCDAKDSGRKPGPPIITTVAGGDLRGDGGPATRAQLREPIAVAVDGSGNLFIADRKNFLIRKVELTTGIITTVAGSGPVDRSQGGTSGDGGPGTSAELNAPRGVAVDRDGDLFIADTYNHRIRKVDVTGTIATVAGTGERWFTQDGIPATSARLTSPSSVAVDLNGNLFIADMMNHRVHRVVLATGIITTMAGTGSSLFGGDGGPGRNAWLNTPAGIAIDKHGNLFIADGWNQRIRKVALATGVITTVVGGGPTGRDAGGFGGDGDPATSARLNFPSGVAVDSQGNLYIADTGNNRIRRVGLFSSP